MARNLNHHQKQRLNALKDRALERKDIFYLDIYNRALREYKEQGYYTRVYEIVGYVLRGKIENERSR